MRPTHKPGEEPASLSEAIDRLLDTGVAACGDVVVSVADIPLVYVGLQAILASVDTIQRQQNAPWEWPLGASRPEKRESSAQTDSMAAIHSPETTTPKTSQALSSPPPKPPRAPFQNTAAGNSSPRGADEGLAQLVLTLVRLLHDVLKRQAARRMESGHLSQQQVEALGLTLMQQAEEIETIARKLGINKEQLNLDLGPFGKLI
jgi:hypothetical protein